MADVMRLTDAINTVDFSPLFEPFRPDFYDRVVQTALSGKLYVYDWSTKSRYEVSISDISSANASIINNWAQNATSLTFYPNYTQYPSQTITVKIINDTRPLQMMQPGWNVKYEGTLMIQET